MQPHPPSAMPSHRPRRRRSAGGQLLRSRAGSLLRWLLPRLVELLSRLLVRTSRIELVGKEHEDAALARSGHIIFAGLHEGMMLLPYHFRDRAGGLVMVSRSRDGDVIADTVERFGLCAVRGSSGRGGGDALREMGERLRRESVSAGIIVDGPRGPARVAKSGAVVLARATGLPIVPGTWWARPALRVGSWDRTLVPLPFARVVFAFEEPLWIAPGTTDAELEGYRAELTRRLDAARERARRLCGRA
jgi:lysophospholipid acyltransferase (LPLAT)-like uncharacterized protein